MSPVSPVASCQLPVLLALLMSSPDSELTVSRVVLFILQIGYVYHLYHQDKVYVAAAANLGSHFVVNNLLLFGFLHLWCRSLFWLGEILLIINFVNLTFAYFRHPTTPRVIHIATLSGPYAWTWVALLWNGAAMVNAHTLAARIVANIFIWSIFGFGLFFLVIYKDYTMGFSLSVLSAGKHSMICTPQCESQSKWWKHASSYSDCSH